MTYGACGLRPGRKRGNGGVVRIIRILVVVELHHCQLYVCFGPCSISRVLVIVRRTFRHIQIEHCKPRHTNILDRGRLSPWLLRLADTSVCCAPSPRLVVAKVACSCRPSNSGVPHQHQHLKAFAESYSETSMLHFPHPRQRVA